MKFRNFSLVLAAAFCLTCAVLPAMAATQTATSADQTAVSAMSQVGPDSTNQPFYALERAETIIYGGPQTGGLLPRISKAEKDVFGRELPGSLTERQTAMLNFLEKGSATQPSLLYKLSTAEWATTRQTHPEWALARRVDNIEMTIDGTTTNGALATRTEKVMTKLLPEGMNAVQVTVPKATVIKASLIKTLTVRNVKVDDKIILSLADELMSNDILIAPRGSRVFAHITMVKPPRSFGRGSVIEMAFDSFETIGPGSIPIGIGDAAKKAMETDGATAGAAAASIGGAVILGPLGLATGALIRGTDNQLKEGSIFYVETAEDATVTGYKIPQQITPFVGTQDQTLPQGNASPINK
jgi:hypothetical protein